MNAHVSAALATEQQILVACDKDVINKANRCTTHTFMEKLIAILRQHANMPIKSTVTPGHKDNLLKYGQIRPIVKRK